MKKILLVFAVATMFVSCQKEELEPAPTTTPTPTPGATETTIYFSKGGAMGSNANVSIYKDSNPLGGSGSSLTNCTTLDYSFVFKLDSVYSITFDNGATEVYAGDIKFTSTTFPNIDLVEITGNTSGTASISTCGSSTELVIIL